MGQSGNPAKERGTYARKTVVNMFIMRIVFNMWNLILEVSIMLHKFT